MKNPQCLAGCSLQKNYPYVEKTTTGETAWAFWWQILDIRSKEGILSWVYLIPFVFKDWLNIQGEIELFNMAGDAAPKGQAERFIARR